ncbi:ABC transporter permease [Algisphaera agarilytica]|uniref:ABC-type transport system involved in multi-copper enzyme maturation permease subunit n=1 Tax=Algisphaera agarilytica TaxID=1385975 RepID=A0A7X0H4J8_9BACT|nr:ABC transporter permease subunit [Algisphaera agarilytica]MBB6428953.1 ABC-type transport system involved in multi-copper enzyme maturation permease subunit [Algisphaera agarilytica]
MQAVGRYFWRLGPGNPMVVRIVEGGSRRMQHMFVRMGYLGLLVILVVIGLLAGPGMSSDVSLGELAKAGSQVFRFIAYGQVLGVCLLAPLFMAGAIASEQSGKTYNILLTTPLTNLQIVLGSLAGRLFFVLALLLSGLPLFAVVLVFGGVRTGSVLMAFAVAGCTAVFVGSVAVTLSVLRAGGRKAVFVFVIGIMAYLVGLYALDRGLVRILDPEPYTTWLTSLHPILVLESSLLSDYTPPPAEALVDYPAPLRFFLGSPFAAFVAWTLGGSVLMVLGCALGLRQVGQGEAKWLISLKRALRISRDERTHAPRQVTGNPIAWREANTRGKMFGGILGRYGFALLGWAGAGLLVWLYHTNRLPQIPASQTAGGGYLPPHEVFHRLLTILLVLEVAVVTLVAIYMSAGCVSREREDGTLDIMLTTPVTPKQYIWGKLRGLVRFLSLMIAVPVLTIVGVSTYALAGNIMGWSQTAFTYYGLDGGAYPDTPLILPEVGLWLALMLVPFIALCVASGMAWSLKAKGVLGAVVPTVGIIGAVVLVMGLCGWSGLGTTALIGPVVNGFSPATNTAMLINPWDRVDGFAGEGEIFGRVSLALAALFAAAGYSMIVYAMIVGMVKGFDQTVRKLSGTG